MFIPRHEVEIDVADARSRYNRALEFTGTLLQTSRDPSRVDILGMLAREAEHVYDCGLRAGSDPLACADALMLAARANTALFVFAESTDPPRRWRLDGGPPVTFTNPADESHLYASRWVDAVQQSVVSRQGDCLEELLPITYERLSRSSTYTTEPERYFHIVERERAVAATALDPSRPVAAAYKAYAAGAHPGQMRPANRRVAEANERMIEAMDGRNAAGFNTALAEALRSFREALAAAPEEGKRNVTALWPLGLIAKVCVAHDRGIPIEVESDYLPAAWVRGELFRRT